MAFGSAAAWVLGFAMMLAANDGIFFPNKLYTYSSPGVIRPGEAENVFSTYREVLGNQLLAKQITIEEMAMFVGEVGNGGKKLEPTPVLRAVDPNGVA